MLNWFFFKMYATCQCRCLSIVDSSSIYLSFWNFYTRVLSFCELAFLPETAFQSSLASSILNFQQIFVWAFLNRIKSDFLLIKYSSWISTLFLKKPIILSIAFFQCAHDDRNVAFNCRSINWRRAGRTEKVFSSSLCRHIAQTKKALIAWNFRSCETVSWQINQIKSKMKSIHLQLAEMRVVNVEKSSRRAASDKLRLLLSHHSFDSFNRTINFMLLWPHK